MGIPIANLYYLLAYAWDSRKPSGLAEAGRLSAQTPTDLIAELLAISVERLLKRGLDRGYVELSQDLQSPRGKLDLSSTAKRGLLRSRKVCCNLAELRRNVPHNQVVKAGLGTLARIDSVDKHIRARLRRAEARMADVESLRLSRQLLRKVQLHRNNFHYRFPLRLAELAWRSQIVRPESGAMPFPDYSANSQEMGLIFERFVRNFLAREQSEYRVSASPIPWDVRALSRAAFDLLPSMRSDVTMARPGARIILEAKFYERPVGQHFGKRSLHSNHLYQLLSYLRNLTVASPRSRVSGVLLYAGTGSPLELDYEFHGIPLLVRSLDLGQPWKTIRRDLLGLVSAQVEKAA